MTTLCRQWVSFVALLVLLAVTPGCERTGTSGDAATGSAADEGANTEGLAAPATTTLVLKEEPPALPSASGSYLAGKYAYNQRDNSEAVAFMQRILLDDPANEGLLQQTFILLLGQGDTEDALEYARKVRDVAEDDFFANLLLATEAFRLENWKEAERYLNAMADSDFRNLLKPLTDAWLLAAKGDTSKALTLLQEEPEEPAQRLHDVHQALLVWQSGDHAQALQLLRKARRGLKNLPLQYALVYTRMLQTVRPDAVEGFINRYLETNGPDELAEQLFDKTRSNTAFPPATPPQSPAQGLAQAYYDIAGTLNQNHSRHIAIVFAQLALHLDPSFDFARLLLGSMLEAENRLGEATTLYEAVERRTPFGWVARLRLAAVQHAAGDTDAAIDTLQDATDDNPALLSAKVDLGDLLRQEERYKEAVRVYSEALELPQAEELGSTWSLHYARGIAYERLDQWPRAASDLNRALELEPDQPYVLNYLAYSWLEQDTNLEKAERMLKTAIDARPNDPYIIDSYGWAKFMQGDYAEAVRILERAVDMKPQDPTINEHLGDAYWRSGRVLEGRFQWKKALSYKPEQKEHRQRLRQKIREGLAPSLRNTSPRISATTPLQAEDEATATP